MFQSNDRRVSGRRYSEQSAADIDLVGIGSFERKHLLIIDRIFVTYTLSYSKPVQIVGNRS
jgi:hypothetical protein